MQDLQSLCSSDSSLWWNCELPCFSKRKEDIGCKTKTRIEAFARSLSIPCETSVLEKVEPQAKAVLLSLSDRTTKRLYVLYEALLLFPQESSSKSKRHFHCQAMLKFFASFVETTSEPTPELQTELQVYRYIIIASVGAYGWDLLSNVWSHYKLLFREKIKLATVAYFVSIFGTTVLLVGCTVFHTGIISNCQLFDSMIAIGISISIPATAFLFLIRAHAVYHDEKIIRWVFYLLWIGVFVASFLNPFAVRGVHLGTTRYCIDAAVRPYGSAGLIAQSIFDTLVFLAVSWKLTCDEIREGKTLSEKFRMFLGGKATTSALRKGMLQSGQLYFLISVCGNLVTTAMMFSPHSFTLYRAILTIPNSVVTNAMACKIFRDLKFRNDQHTKLPSLPPMECEIPASQTPRGPPHPECPSADISSFRFAS